ncbi:MAG: hypothetical protein RIS35_466, partial [Pseudomonadota bacterium]
PFDLAVAGGFAADRAGWAFAAGYQASLHALIPGLPTDRLLAFCVTEETGNRPKDVQTRCAPAPGGGFVLNGAKRWAMIGPGEGLLLIAANAGEGERPEIRMARVPTGAPGLRIDAMPPTRFVPEVPHARLALEDVRIGAEDLLPGDGHDRYVKPMRTLEDTLVTAALLACLVREARLRAWPREWITGALGALSALAEVARRAPGDPVTHLLLGGALEASRRTFDEAAAHWGATPEDPAAQRWTRDAVLTGMAGPVRAQRLARAWERVSQPG